MAPQSIEMGPKWGGFLLLLLAMAAAGAEYPSPESAGFHHCALIYDCAQRSSRELAPYVAYTENGTPRVWLFDTFLFLILRAPSGRLSARETKREDWQYHLDRWFTPGRDLDALDEAIDRARAKLGPPPAKRRVILSIPRLSPRVTDFGDVDGDGKTENLSTAAGMKAVLDWYTRAVRKRFAAARFKYLELWGFYWMHEAIRPAEEASTRAAAETVHALGGKFLWIPWFQAPGWDRWRECGFDVTILQPNYAFFSKHHGSVRRSRLAQTADLARTHGLGVEIELPMRRNDPATASYCRRYLADGATTRYGYQAAATAYYLGVSDLERLCRSDLGWQRELYEAIAAYVRNQVVPDPDPRPDWRVAGQSVPELGDGWLTGGREARTAEARLARPAHVAAVDVHLDEPSADRSWQGRLVVDVRQNGAGSWHPGGWAIRSGHNKRNGRWQVVTVPVRVETEWLRVRFKPARPGSRPPAVAEIGIDSAAIGGKVVRHLAQGLPYRFDPAPDARYGDSGRELTDGVVPAGGFASGGTVGWQGRQVAIAFDVQRIMKIDRVEVHVEGGGYAGVNWPSQASLMLATAAPPPPRLAGTGAAPDGFTWRPGGPVVLDRRRSPDAADGHIAFQPEALARYATLLLRSNGWLMVSEVRIISAGKNVAPASRYTLYPAPTGPGSEKYPDDYTRLTDGIIAHTFSPAMLSGWSDDGRRTITIDLGAVRPVRRVVAWTLAGGRYAIYAPSQIQVQTSIDGHKWQSLGRARRPGNLVEEGSLKAVAYEIMAAQEVRTRRVRATVTRSRGWAMLSEIVVE